MYRGVATSAQGLAAPSPAQRGVGQQDRPGVPGIHPSIHPSIRPSIHPVSAPGLNQTALSPGAPHSRRVGVWVGFGLLGSPSLPLRASPGKVGPNPGQEGPGSRRGMEGAGLGCGDSREDPARGCSRPWQRPHSRLWANPILRHFPVHLESKCNYLPWRARLIGDIYLRP